jgi:uridylate kinase
VDGIYSADPKRDPQAVRYERLTFDEALIRDLKVMDGTAFALARDAAIPIVVFCVEAEDSIGRVLTGDLPSTLVSAD